MFLYGDGMTTQHQQLSELLSLSTHGLILWFINIWVCWGIIVDIGGTLYTWLRSSYCLETIENSCFKLLFHVGILSLYGSLSVSDEVLCGYLLFSDWDQNAAVIVVSCLRSAWYIGFIWLLRLSSGVDWLFRFGSFWKGVGKGTKVFWRMLMLFFLSLLRKKIILVDFLSLVFRCCYITVLLSFLPDFVEIKGVVKMVPTKPMVVETFVEYPPLGWVAVRLLLWELSKVLKRRNQMKTSFLLLFN